MKKFALMLALALPAVMVSCGDDDDKTIELDKTAVTLDYKTDVTLNASEKDCTWATSDAFVADVDGNGKVTAKHVGEAVITVSKDGVSATCRVKVTPVDDSFTMPVLEFGAKKATVETLVPVEELGLTKVTDEEFDNETTLFYTTAGLRPWYSYEFNEDKLVSAALNVDEVMDDALSAYLAQYYKRDKSLETEDTGMILINGESASTATVAVDYDMLENSVQATWTTADAYTRGGKFINTDAIKAHKAMVRKMLAK